MFDVAGHELAHVFLDNDGNPLISNGLLEGKSLQEGIADMIGTYVEFVQSGNLDWQIRDDDPTLNPGRNLQNPQYTCFTDVDEVSETTSEHVRSTPLGHWFYLITDGDASYGIAALGIEKAKDVILGSLPFMNPSGDYPELRDAVLTFVDSEFGPCSDEGTAVRNAWNKICVGTPSCGFNIVGPNQVCEEDDNLTLCVSGGLPGAPFRWYFPSGWTVQGNVSGNTVVGPCLIVTDFPKYNWYPRYFSIKAVMLGTGVDRTTTVKLVDCLGDDPTCEEYHSLEGGIVEDRSRTAEQLSELSIENVYFIKVHDISGRLLLNGSASEFNKNELGYFGIVVISCFDIDGNFIKAEKAFY